MLSPAPAEAPQRLRRIGGGGEAGRPASASSSSAGARSSSWASSISTWAKRSASSGRRSHQGERVEHERAVVAGAAEHPLVEPVDLGELPLGHRLGAALGQRARPTRAYASALIPSAFSRSMRRMKPADQRRRVAADVVVGERQLVDPLDEHRHPVAAPDGRQRQLGRAGHLLERASRAAAGPGRAGSGSGASRSPAPATTSSSARIGARPAGRGRDHEQPVRRGAGLDQPPEAGARSAPSCPPRARRAPAAGGGPIVREGLPQSGKETIGDTARCLPA